MKGVMRYITGPSIQLHMCMTIAALRCGCGEDVNTGGEYSAEIRYPPAKSIIR